MLEIDPSGSIARIVDSGIMASNEQTGQLRFTNSFARPSTNQLRHRSCLNTITPWPRILSGKKEVQGTRYKGRTTAFLFGAVLLDCQIDSKSVQFEQMVLLHVGPIC
jgi:hypothetical protein